MSKSKSLASKTTKERDDLQERVDKLSKELEEAQSASRKAEGEQGNLQNELKDLRKQHKQASDKATTLQTKLDDLQSAHDTLQTSSKSQSSELSSLKSTLSTTQSQLKDTEAASATVSARRDALQKDNEELMADLTELREKTIRLTDDLAEKSEKLDTATRSIREKDTESDRLRSELETTQESSKGVEGKLKESEKEAKELKEKVERAQREVEYAQDEAKARENEIDQLRSKLSKADSENSQAMKRSQSAQEEIEAHKTKLEAAENQAEEEKSRRTALDEELASLKDQLEQQQSEIEELRTFKSQTEAEAASAEKAPEFSPLTPANAVSPLEHKDNIASEESSDSQKKQIEDMQKQIDDLNALVLIERDKAMKAMTEVFGMGSTPSPSRPIQQQAPASHFALSAPAAQTESISPTTIPDDPISQLQSTSRRPPAFAHRRSASHLPTLNENLQASQRRDFDYSPKGSLVPLPSPPIRLPSPSTERRSFLRSSGPLPPATRHARRQSLTMLKSRMEEELGMPDILAQQSVAPQIPGAPALQQHDHRRPAAKLGQDLIWCVHSQPIICIAYDVLQVLELFRRYAGHMRISC